MTSSSLIRDDLEIGSRVTVNNEHIGTVRYLGTTSFQTGKWVGVELDEKVGKNSGVVQGKRYFDCKIDHGVFTRPTNVKLVNEPIISPMQRRKSIVPNPNKTASPGLSQRRKSIANDTPPSTTQRRKSVVSDATLKKKSMIPSTAPSTQRRKSIAGDTPPPLNTLQRKKSIVPSSPSSPVTSTMPNTQTLKKRPTSLLQQSTTSRGTVTPTTGSKSTAIKRKSLIPPSNTTTVTRRARSNTQSMPPPQSILKSTNRLPITAPSTPDTADQSNEFMDENIKRLELEQAKFDALCLENTQANAAVVSSPVSLEESDESSKGSSSTPQFQKKEPVYGSLATETPISKSEQTVPLKDYEELRFKLKILESKRVEDREKFRDYEKVKEEAEQFLTLRNKLLDKIADLQKDVRDTKRDLKEITAEKKLLETKYNDVLESMEMLTLDKEVAEERAENLQQEANMLKDRIEEISIDLDILKKEADFLNRPPEFNTLNAEDRTPLEVIQLERHNERLREALLKLRDVAAEQENELNLKIKQLEQENYDLEDIRFQYETTLEKLATAELLVEDLRMQVDDASGAEDLVEQLTEKNLNLTEKLDELSATVDDLEALRELADELEENHIETEKQLQAEIDHRDMLLREQVERLKAHQETETDYEATIQQFRELVTLLQNDLERFKHKEKESQNEKVSLSSQSQAMMSLNMQLQNTVMKSQAKSIDIELRKLDTAQAIDRLAMSQPYLPDSFFKTENDPISCLLLFKRLEFKAALIVKHLDQNYPVSEKIMDNVTENLITMCEIKQRAGWLNSLATRFHAFIANSDSTTFATMGKVYHDLVGVERKVNGIVESFRTDQVNESQILVEIQRVISQVEHTSEVYLDQYDKNNADQFFGITKTLDLNADRMIVILTFCKQTLNNAVRNDGLLMLEGAELMDQNYLEPLGRLIAQAKNSKIVAKKIMRELEDKFEEAMTLRSDYLHRFKMLYAISSKLCRFCFEVYEEILSYVNTKTGGQEPLELSFVRKILCEKSDQVFEMVESAMWESALRNLKTLSNELETTYSQIERDEKLDKIVTTVAPWMQRASDIKAEVIINHELEHKLQQHNEEIVKLIKDLKLKDQTLQEADVKISLLEKRMEVAKKEMEQIKTLEEDLEKSMNQEQMYVEALENLQNEYDALETENNELKKEVNKREEKRQSLIKKTNFDLPTDTEDNMTIQEMEGEYDDLASQVETLRASVRYLRAENAQLKCSDFAKSLNLSDEDNFILSYTKNNQDKLHDVARETRVLIKDIRAASASPRIVQLESKGAALWTSLKKSPDYQYQTQQSVLYTLKQRGEQLKAQVSKLGIATPSLSKQPNQQEQIPLGVIRIPKTNTIPIAKHCVNIHNAVEFKRLHSLFIQS